ncbi:glycoside hydrolase family 16 protein [Mixia osmundae IAM 14324]|uniref:Uncharacterized protein n=1 Tax=Mixia osmundae (strain CBS 9802 / IAM 14324 / JCM 22182 / KY 12970) TaxID=764103 RepID=G7DYQ1_MIXOS|nr:glycoside hydrolase family 16 protein [Mixia osmundae IAM 14324]KEI41611.1 glycoside hydrolase family 16 protein [Mixia osmundae IAM 14324]GAA95711.1 hypothetical protein E5Q_02368 [Mixia osmundae IAM 14324]
MHGVLIALSLTSVHATQYALKDRIVGAQFYDRFDWYTEDDPTHGAVRYVTLNESLLRNMTSVYNGSFYLGVDAHLQPALGERASTRIKSKASYSEALIVLDLQHMPAGPGTWPAFWTSTANYDWPYGAEIDIIEGTNDQGPALSSLHTGPNCTMPTSDDGMTGERTTYIDCDSTFVQTGCGVSNTMPARVSNAVERDLKDVSRPVYTLDDRSGDPATRYSLYMSSRRNRDPSYGPEFNARGGGIWAMQRSLESIKIFYWLRDDPALPAILLSPHRTTLIDTLNWIPSAYFPLDQCDLSQWGAHEIILNTDLCGDLASEPFRSLNITTDDCPTYVRDHPEALQDAYWSVNALTIFTPLLIAKR